MKTTNPLATLAALIALTGCDPNAGYTPVETPASTGTVIELPKENAVVELNKTPTSVSATADKSAFIASTEQKLKDFDAKVDELAKKAEGYKDDAKAQADSALATLREQRGKLSAQFDSVKQSSTEAWKDVKAGFESALNELEKAYENAKAKFTN